MFKFWKSREERARLSQADPRDPVVAKWFGNTNATEAGIFMSEDKALTISTVYACVKVLSESVAILPLLLRKDQGETGDIEEKNYYLSGLFKRRPNAWQTPIEYKQMMVAHMVLRGFAASRIMFTPQGKIDQLIPLHPDRVTPFMAPDGRRAYSYQPASGPRQTLLQDEVFYIPGLTDDGVKPMSVIAYAKETFGLAYAVQQYGSRYFKNNASPGGVMQHPSKLGDEAYQRLKTDWEARHQGSQNAGKVAILEEGMTWQTLGMTAHDAQFVESRKISPIEICQFFRMPPHKVAILDRATFSNIEHQSLEFVMDTLMPWLVKIEQSANRDLLQNKNEQQYFYKHHVDEMLRGDMATRYTGYASALQNRWLNRNEVRQREGLQPIADGDKFELPNMAVQPPKFPEPSTAPGQGDKKNAD